MSSSMGRVEKNKSLFEKVVLKNKIKHRLSYVRQRVNHWKNAFLDNNPKLLVLIYHRVLPSINFNPLNTIVTVDTFLSQINTLAKSYPIISLSDAISQCHKGASRQGLQIVLTFDDGYWDNFEIVFPILYKKGIPATFFLATDYVGHQGPLWDWELFAYLNQYKTIQEVTVGNECIRHNRMESRRSFAYRIFNKMKALDSGARRKVYDDLQSNGYEAHPVNLYTPDGLLENRFMTWSQVKKMSESGMEIGSHGVSHCSLSRVPVEKAHHEITYGKGVIEKEIGKKCETFAFPYGSAQDYNDDLVNQVKAAGFQKCLLNIHGYNHFSDNSFCLKRIIMDESTSLKHLLG